MHIRSLQSLVNKKCLLSIDCIPQGVIAGNKLAVFVADEGLEHGGVMLCVPEHLVTFTDDREIVHKTSASAYHAEKQTIAEARKEWRRKRKQRKASKKHGSPPTLLPDHRTP